MTATDQTFETQTVADGIILTGEAASKVKALEILAKHHQLLVDRQVIDLNVREHQRAVPQSTLDAMFQPSDRPDA